MVPLPAFASHSPGDRAWLRRRVTPLLENQRTSSSTLRGLPGPSHLGLAQASRIHPSCSAEGPGLTVGRKPCTFWGPGPGPDFRLLPVTCLREKGHCAGRSDAAALSHTGGF